MKTKRHYTVPAFFGLLLTLFLFSGCSQTAASPSDSKSGSYQQISSKEAAAMIEEEEDYLILDVRTPEEFEEAHIPEAVNVPNETIGTEEIPELPDKEQLIFVYCRSGNRSKQASQKLADLGYTNIIEFGGINDWSGDTVTGR